MGGKPRVSGGLLDGVNARLDRTGKRIDRINKRIRDLEWSLEIRGRHDGWISGRVLRLEKMKEAIGSGLCDQGRAYIADNRGSGPEVPPVWCMCIQCRLYRMVTEDTPVE